MFSLPLRISCTYVIISIKYYYIIHINCLVAQLGRIKNECAISYPKQNGVETCPMCLREFTFEIKIHNKADSQYLIVLSWIIILVLSAGIQFRTEIVQRCSHQTGVIIFLDQHVQKYEKQSLSKELRPWRSVQLIVCTSEILVTH